MNIKPLITTLVVGELQTNCYMLSDSETREALIIDPGDAADYISSTLSRLQLKPTYIIATHGHFDHILAAYELQKAYAIPFLMHTKDQFLLDRLEETASYFLKRKVVVIAPEIDQSVKHDDVLKIGKVMVKIIETPGHTPGSLSLQLEASQEIFTGDTLFAEGGVGRTDFSYSNKDSLDRSVKMLLKNTAETVLYPGHGISTTIADLNVFFSF